MSAKDGIRLNSGILCRRSERGAVLVETAAVGVVLFLLAMGAVELGLLFRQASEVADTVRSGARTASAVSNAPSADYDILMAMKDSDSGLAGEIQKVVIYKADANGNPANPNCANFVAAANQCSVFTADQFNMSRNEMITFSATGKGWHPDKRKPGVDYIGVRVLSDRHFITKVFGTNKLFEDKAVVRLEARPATTGTSTFSNGVTVAPPDGLDMPCTACGPGAGVYIPPSGGQQGGGNG